MSCIAQLSDLHLKGKVGKDDSYQMFLSCLDLACQYRPTLLVLTGDLVNNGQKQGYDWLCQTLHQTGIRYVLMAGNHDVTYEHNSHLPFHLRHFSPLVADDRLSDCTCLEIGAYQLLCLNSAVSGQTHGHLSDKSLAWLRHALSSKKPTLIALHHHPLPVNSLWIDAYQLKNAQAFWQTLAPFRHIRAIICGHVHQAHTLHRFGTPLYTAPAVSRQFAPFCDDFTLHGLPSGIRLFWLGERQIDSKVVRLDNTPIQAGGKSA